ncbi:TonB-dependent receptor [Foetidibacter luteolus]|uniref:TonB-dependent receptor n=1 Tax=Foetidibacter luteolus TaxID=2608880 RepID=UPI00129AC096|nr:TonB-dependent receptor [Foetidibacter luteolus]
MKKFLGTCTLLCIVLITSAQYSIKGTVSGKQNQPLKDVSVTLKPVTGRQLATVTGDGGIFSFTNLPDKLSGTLVFEFVGKKRLEQHFTISGSNFTADALLEDNNYFLEPLEIKAVRASDKAPFTKVNLSKTDIEKNNFGQDLPFVLNQTPSVVVNSDAGNGVGYTGIRIRGTDGTRINVTLNGIPYNDAESHGSFFVDMPDFTSSVNSIQIQRGVGTSTNGAGAFGATINLSTNEFNEKPYGEINNSYGSFSTWKNTVKAGSGLIDDHFTVDVRLSRLSSDGYIERASSNLQSFYFSGAYTAKKTSVRFNIFSGKEKTYQAWNGVPESMLATNRRYNSLGMEKPGTPYSDQTDNYVQTHYQLFLNQAISDHLSLNLASFLTRGKGYYEEYKAGESFADYNLPNFVTDKDTITHTDLVRRRWLDNYYYGQVVSLQYKKNNDELTFGGGWTQYDGKHYGQVIWAQAGVPSEYEYYRFPATKKDMNIYAKWLHSFSSGLSIFADMQYRRVMHEMLGFADNPQLNIKRTFGFVNPKAGISYSRNGWNAYLSYAMANKEPNRNDFEAGATQQPDKETLHDFELAVEKKYNRYSWGATLYYMLYNNQLVQTGKINDVGAYTRINVPNSYRLGIELQAGVKVTDWLNASAGATFSRNKIKAFDEFVDDYDNGGQLAKAHRNTDISFSPSVIANGAVNIIPVKNSEISFISKYVGRQYMDNTQDKSRSLSDYYVQDIRAAYTFRRIIFREWSIAAQVNNVFSRKYEPNGYTFSYLYESKLATENYYFPMAGTNYMVALNIKL